MSDVTRAYQEALQSADRAERALELLAGHTVVWVRGFLSEAVVMLGNALRQPADLAAQRLIRQAGEALEQTLPLPRPRRTVALGRYFDDQREWLEARGVRCLFVDIESEAPIEENAEQVVKALDAAPGEHITLVTHSKGCLDALDALLRREPEAWSRIRRWVAIQGPFQGTPIADIVATNPTLRKIAQTLLEKAGGKLEGLTGMQTFARSGYQDRHEQKIRALLRGIPTLCVASHVPPQQLHDTFLGAPLLLIQVAAGANDGLVPATSALLPGARHVTLSGVDHAMPVMESFGSFARVDSLQALLCALPARA